MVTVPEYRRQVQQRPVNQTSAQVRTSSDTFGAGLGRAAGQIAQGVFDAADAVDFKDQLTQDAEAREAYNGYRRAQREALRAPETGYLNRTGANGIDVQTPAEQRLRELRKEYGAGLKPRARKKYDSMVDEMQDQAHGQLLTHTSNETRNYIENQRKSTIEGYAEEAATNWNDQEAFDRNLGLALEEQNQLANLQGWDDATRTQAAENLISGTVKQRIVLTAAEDPLAAAEMLENSRDALNAGDEYALDTNLKQLVIDAKADKFVQGFVVRGSGTGSSVVSPYGAARVRAESGGNPYAANNKANPGFAAPDGSASSALGLNQILRGTYLQAVREMRSEGGAAWAAGMTENEIALTRTNPAIEGTVQAYLERQDEARLRSIGLPPTPVNKYAMHHFGSGDGPELLLVAMNDPSRPASEIFSPAVFKANPQFKGKTAGQVFDWIANHLGADGASVSGERAFFDANAAFQAAMLIEDPDEQKAALQRINTLRTMQDNARSSSQQQAQEAAWNIYAETGNADLGYEMMQAMGQGGWTAFQNAVANDREGIDATQPETWEMLTAASMNPREFASVNLEAHRANLSKADFRQFYAQQQEAKKSLETAAFETAKTKAGIPYGAMYGHAEEIYRSMVDDTSEADMDKDQRRQRVEFQRQLNQLIGEFFDREAREPSQTEVRSMALALALPVSPSDGGWFTAGSGASLFHMANRPDGVSFEVDVSYEDVPYADRARIAAELTVNGETPTNKEIADAYERETMMRAGLPPRVEVDDVPEGFAVAVKGANPNATDVDIVEAYQAYLMDKFNP